MDHMRKRTGYCCVECDLRGRFLFERTPGIPLNDPMYFGRFHAPILMLYGVAFLLCVFEALLYLPRDRKLQTGHLIFGQK